MLEASTSGHAQLKHKTINAEVNLLSEWRRNRATMVDQITRMAVGLTLVSLLTFGSLPFLMRAFVNSGARVRRGQAVLREKQAIVAALEQKKKLAAPRLDQGAIHDTVVREAKQFLGQTLFVVNAAQAGMAFDSVKASVISGELKINCKAETETNAVVQEFMARANQGPNVQSNLLVNVQNSTKLGPDGVAFEYSKTVGVTP